MAAATEEAVDAGIGVLAAGGNAMDAAVAVSLALGATESSESGLGGRAVVLVMPADGEGAVYHSPASLERWEAAGGRTFGPPTLLPVLAAAWERHGSGSVPWEDLVEPAVRAAEEGTTLGRFRHRVLVSEYARVEADSGAAALLLNDDRSIPTEGSTVSNPLLAETLAELADAGPEAFLGGEGGLAAALARVGLSDARSRLDAIRVARAAPIAAVLGGDTVFSAPEPHAGPILLEALAVLAEAPEGVLAREGAVRTAWLAEALARSVGGAGAGEGLPPLPAPLPDSASVVAPRTSGGETSHFSVVDGQGNAVAVTQSLGRPFGAGVPAGELGFFLAAPVSDEPGARTAVLTSPGEEAGDTAGGSEGAERPAPAARWWVAPTVVRREGRPVLVAGSAGGPPGVSALAQVAADVLLGGVPLTDAVERPRLHAEPSGQARARIVPEGFARVDPGAAASEAPAGPSPLEPWGGDSLFLSLTARRGLELGEHDVGPRFQELDPWFGGVHAVGMGDEGPVAAGDPRRDGGGRTVERQDVLEAREGGPEEPEDTTPAVLLPPDTGASGGAGGATPPSGPGG